MKNKLLFSVRNNVLSALMVFGVIAGLNAQTKITSENIIGNTTTYQNDGTQDLSIAWDGNYDTSVDTGENWGFVGYDFGEGNEKQIANWKYAPRTGYAGRMNGTELRGSNSSNFLNDFETLYTISSDPVENALTDAVITSSTAYRYVYWYGKTWTYSNISEFELYDAGSNKLTGTIVGNPVGSEWCSDCLPDKAFDNDFDTYVEGPYAIGWVGYDFGTEGVKIQSFKFAPRNGYSSRMVNSELRGSNSSDYFVNYTVLHTITTAPTEGVMTDIAISDINNYRYVYWIGLDPDTGNSWMDSYGNIGEFELYTNTLSSKDFEVNNFRIFPNPSNGNTFKIALGSFQKAINIKVYDILGKNVLNKDFSSASKTIEVNHNLKAGIYLVKINNSTSSKLIVK